MTDINKIENRKMQQLLIMPPQQASGLLLTSGDLGRAKEDWEGKDRGASNAGRKLNYFFKKRLQLCLEPAYCPAVRVRVCAEQSSIIH